MNSDKLIKYTIFLDTLFVYQLPQLKQNSKKFKLSLNFYAYPDTL